MYIFKNAQKMNAILVMYVAARSGIFPIWNRAGRIWNRAGPSWNSQSGVPFLDKVSCGQLPGSTNDLGDRRPGHTVVRRNGAHAGPPLLWDNPR